MNTTLGLDECLSFINCQLQSSQWARRGETGNVKCVTVSRQSGCGAHVFAEELAAWLREHISDDPTPWTIFDRSLVEAVLRDHHLPSRLAAFMPEDRVSQVDDIIHDLLSLHPPTELLVRQTSETILHLAELGHVIILGRGGNLITARLAQTLHVRLVGSLEQRVDHMKKFDKLSRKDALARIRGEDGGRRRYLKRYFGKDIDDPLQFHLVINTDLLTFKEAAAMVGGLVVSHTVPETKPPVTAPAANS